MAHGPRKDVQDAAELARLILDLGKVQRATRHPDGTPESDTTHSMMLALIAYTMAPDGMDLELVLLYALVHDLVEAHAGDTNTARELTREQRAAKDRREVEARVRISGTFRDTAFAWIPDLIDEYEAQISPEARFVRYLDKTMPKLTHALDGGAALASMGMGSDELVKRHRSQGAELAEQYPEQADAREFFDAACRQSEDATRDRLSGLKVWVMGHTPVAEDRRFVPPRWHLQGDAVNLTACDRVVTVRARCGAPPEDEPVCPVCFAMSGGFRDTEARLRGLIDEHKARVREVHG